MPAIDLPTIELRPYQLNAWRAFEEGQRRILMCWPRRGGKDTMSLQMLGWGAHREVGNYWHLMPEATQCRKAMWEGINREGKRIIDVAFPPELRKSTNNGEMFIRLKNGSTIQFGGSDRYDALVGSNPKGVVFSEYAISNPNAYNFVRPILLENHGFAIFPYTPRGRNHGYRLFNQLSSDPGSFAELLTCDDTGHMSEEGLALERKEMSEELFLQEYYGSFDFGVEGAIYASYINKARQEGRLCRVPYDSSRPVFAAFDLGFSDATCIWFFQLGKGDAPEFIDYEQDRGKQVDHYSQLLRDKGYDLQELYFPHDGDHVRLGQATAVIDQFRQKGWQCRMLPQERSVAAGIERCRVQIGRAVFDEVKCETGLDALQGYHYEYDDKLQRFKDNPHHDWASDGADAFRYACQAIHLGYTSPKGWGAMDYSTLNRAAI